MEEEDSFQLPSDDDMEPIYPDISPTLVSNLLLAINNFSDQTSDIKTYAGKNPNLAKLANAINLLLRQDKPCVCSPDAFSTILKGFEVFTSQIIQEKEIQISALTPPASPFTSTDGRSPEEISSELNNLRRDLEEQRKRVSKLEFENKKLEENNKALKKENDEGIDERQDLYNKINEIRRENDNKLTQITNDLDRSNNDKQNLNAKIVQYESDIKRITKQRDDANEEVNQLNQKLVPLQNKIQSKSDKIELLQASEQRLKQRVRDLENDIQATINEKDKIKASYITLQKQSVNNSPEVTGKLTERINNLTQTNEQLSHLVESQAEDIVSGRQIVSNMGNVIQKLQEAMEIYDTTANDAVRDRDKARADLDKQQHKLTEANEEIDRLQKELNEMRSGAGKYGSLMVETKKVLDARFGNPEIVPEDIPEIVADLCKGATDSELREQNSRLMDTVENQLRFVQGIVMNGEVNEFLLQSSEHDPIAEDQEFKEKILICIARARQALVQGGLKAEPMDARAREIFETLNQEHPLCREAFECVAAQAINGESIRRLSEKVRAQYAATISELSSVGDIVNFEGADEELGAYIAEKLRNFATFASRAHDAIPDEFDYKNYDATLDFIARYLHTSGEVVRQVTELKDTLNFDGDVTEVPLQCRNRIDELEHSFQAGGDQTIDVVQMQLEDAREEYERELEARDQTISMLEAANNDNEYTRQQLEEQLEKTSKENNEMQEQMFVLQQKKDEAERQNKRMSMNYNGLEEDLNNARAEIDRLRNEIEKNKIAADARLERMMKNQRDEHEEDMRAAQDRARNREQQLNEEIAQRSKKLKEIKARLAESEAEHDEAFRNQQKVTEELRAQNEELQEKLNKQTTEDTTSIRELEQLRGSLRMANAEKAVAQQKAEEASERAAKAAADRDAMWKAQMADREASITRALTAEADDAREQLANLADRVSATFKALQPPRYNKDSIDAVAELAKTAGKRISELEAQLKKRDTRGADLKKVAQTMASLQEWDRWARDLYVNVTSGEVPSQSARELRYMLGERVLSSINHRSLMYRLESLRAQKEALVKGVPPRAEGERTLKGVFIAVTSIQRMLKKSGHLSTTFVSLTTPRKTMRGTPTKSSL